MWKPFIPVLIVCFLFILQSCDQGAPRPTNASEDLKVSKSNTENTSDKTSDPRMAWQKPEKVIAALGDIQGKVIADLGAGIGYFSFKLLPKCQKVIAIDIDKDVTELLTGFKNTMNDDQQSKFDVRLATPSESRLQSKEVDIILIVNTITFIEDRTAYLQNLRSHLKDRGQVFIVDFKSKRIPSYTEAPEISDRVYVHILEDELVAAGYKNIEVDDTTLDFQFMISAEL